MNLGKVKSPSSNKNYVNNENQEEVLPFDEINETLRNIVNKASGPHL